MDASYDQDTLIDEHETNEDCYLGVGAVMPNELSVNEINELSHPMHVSELLSITK